MFALEDRGYREGRGERREPPAKPGNGDLAKVNVEHAREAIRDIARDSAADRVRRDSRPGSAGGVMSAHRVLGQISNDAAERAKKGREKKNHVRCQRSPSQAAKRPLRIAPKRTAKHPPTQTCQIAARSTKRPE